MHSSAMINRMLAQGRYESLLKLVGPRQYATLSACLADSRHRSTLALAACGLAVRRLVELKRHVDPETDNLADRLAQGVLLQQSAPPAALACAASGMLGWLEIGFANSRSGVMIRRASLAAIDSIAASQRPDGLIGNGLADTSIVLDQLAKCPQFVRAVRFPALIDAFHRAVRRAQPRQESTNLRAEAA